MCAKKRNDVSIKLLINISIALIVIFVITYIIGYVSTKNIFQNQVLSSIGESAEKTLESLIVLNQGIDKYTLIIGIAFIITLSFFCLVFMKIKGKVVHSIELLSLFLKDISNGRAKTLPENTKDYGLNELNEIFLHAKDLLSEHIEHVKQNTIAAEKIESELRVAEDIQISMLPKNNMNNPEIDVYADLRPAKQVGGDFYDFYFLNEDEFGFIIGDVSGKGIPASLLMSTIISLFRAISQHDNTPANILNLMNQSIYREEESGLFVTIFIGVLNIRTGRLKFCNAGHPFPILYDDDKSFGFYDVGTNLPLGVSNEYFYEEQECYLTHDTKLVLYTDGIIEAQNEASEFYTDHRLINVAKTMMDMDVESIVKNIISDVDAFVGDADQFDDLTMLALQFK